MDSSPWKPCLERNNTLQYVEHLFFTNTVHSTVVDDWPVSEEGVAFVFLPCLELDLLECLFCF